MIFVLATVAQEPNYATYADGFGITLGVYLFVLGIVWGIGVVRRLLDA
jgi:hypothetical protein